MKKHRILAINPGSTSTKIAVFDDMDMLFEKTLRHSKEELAPFTTIAQQFSFRKNLIVEEVIKNGMEINSIDIIVGRGGLVKPIESGVYEMNQTLSEDLRKGVMGQHASNLGGLIANDIAAFIDGAKAYIADPVVVDEMSEVAHVSGHPRFKRISIFHALNQKAVSRLYAESRGMCYEDMNLVVAHMGGGISVGAHLKGRVVDVNNALDGEGAFSPERSGSLPIGQLIELCFSEKYSKQEISTMVCGEGGVSAHLGTNNIKDVVDKATLGDSKCRLIIEAMCYGVSKQIGEMAVVLDGKVDAVILTGGIAYSDYVCDYIRKKVEFIAPIVVYGGEDEMSALAMNALYVANGKMKSKMYI